MSTYPIAYEQHPPVKRNRLTVFFRFLTVIPHLIWAYLYGIAFFVVSVLAWFAILFTGHFPKGLYDFTAGYLRFITRVYAYCLLIVDEFPPFDGAEHPDYPIRVVVGPPAAHYSRLKAFFRLILAIPIFILQYAMQIWLVVVSIGIWFVAVFTGSTPPSLTEAMHFPASYYVRSSAYVYLMTDMYPSLSDTEAMPVPPAALPA
ncbi:MAG: hypothetical protein QOG42_222 [Solirubrobacteraceae bacterium]|jgi:hypothetical protein|nr:hypothetical protein [Solirubrobacteraceae bacterium]